jgi:flagellar biosynthesis protein FlhB
MNETAEKPFEATPRRISKALREGNVARSSEPAANLSFAAAALSVAAIAPIFGGVAGTAIAACTSGNAQPSSALIPACALVVVAAAAAGATIGGCLQTGGLHLTPVMLKLERLDPAAGIKRILSLETLAHSLRSSVAFACASLAMTPFVAATAVALMRAATPSEAAAAAWTGAREVAAVACAVGFGFAFAEYGAARRAWLRKLRMSFEERKRETKEEEGDATARGRRRALHRALLRGGMQRLKDAAFVIANPQHVAVALEYRPPAVPVPRVLVRAADAVALRVRAIAASQKIPVVENVWLARALYRDARAGEPIPPAHYVAVAEIVTALLRVKELELT